MIEVGTRVRIIADDAPSHGVQIGTEAIVGKAYRSWMIFPYQLYALDGVTDLGIFKMTEIEQVEGGE